jgi:hypothetical protein
MFALSKGYCSNTHRKIKVLIFLRVQEDREVQKLDLKGMKENQSSTNAPHMLQ